MDQVYSFKIGEKNPTLQINPRTGNPGTLELHVVRGPGAKGQVFLFKGAMNKEECETALKGEVPNFLLGANSSWPAFVTYDGNQTQFTLFTSGEEAIGYVRICEYGQ